MDAAEPQKPVQIQRWLPYVAVFQADVHQTLRNWVYRAWVLFSLLAMAGYLLYRFGPYHNLGVVTTASAFVSDLLRWTVLVSAALVVVLTAGCISSERGTMADSVLSRGISRYQYFLGKWHARLVTVLGTYFFTAALALASGTLMLEEDLSLGGSAAALVTVAALLAAVISASVAVSALVNSTVMGIAILWVVVYGGGFALNFMPGRFPAPDKTLQNLLNMLRGQYDAGMLGQLVGYSLLFSTAVAIIGMGFFSRRDV